MTEFFEPDGPSDARMAMGQAPGRLADLNAAGVLSAADLQLAHRLADLAARDQARRADRRNPAPEHPDAVLVLALCARALRTGSVCVDLAALPELPPTCPVEWPEVGAWERAIDDSALVASGVLHRTASLVHLDRYFREEEQVATDLLARTGHEVEGIDAALLETGLGRIFAGEHDGEQKDAARHAVTRRTTVLTGGPGTGKTTTVSGILALLREQHARTQGPALRIALAAPTGKAAARLAEAIVEADRRRAEAEKRSGEKGPGEQGSEECRTRLRAAGDGGASTPTATTLHRLLGWTPESSIRFKHHRAQPLPYDVVVVDEASMLSLTMTARLLEALHAHTRLILVGDPDQLASVEAGAVLADVVEGFSGNSPVVRLKHSHRFDGQIGELAAALRDDPTDADADPHAEGEGVVVKTHDTAADRVVAIARNDAGVASAAGPVEKPGEQPTSGRVHFDPLEVDSSGVASPATERQLEQTLREHVLPHARKLREAARTGDVEKALEALAQHRLLCAHRSGPRGVATQNQRIEAWLAETDPGVIPGGSYAGRPLLVVRNDPQLGLFNGDTGIVVPGEDGGLRAVFATSPERRILAVSRLGDVETMHAMTIHKAQGSQAKRITVVLPEADSRLLTRELLYTGVTRAEQEVRLIGSESALRAAVERRVQRASGLQQRLSATGRSSEAVSPRSEASTPRR